MAAPADKTLTSLCGHWKLNKDLSTPSGIARVLAIQGTSSLLQHAISSATVTLVISEPGQNEYDVKQSAISTSIPGTTEHYNLDNKWRRNHDPFFGEVKGRSRWITIEEATKDYPELKGDWENYSLNEKLVLAEGGTPDGSWTASRLWGFEKINGERRYTQRVKAGKHNGEEITVLMVYDFIGKA